MVDFSKPTSSRTEAAFRTAINGLRGWAVLMVVLYHFGLPGWAGGFVGVDVFFVISGLVGMFAVAVAVQHPEAQEALATRPSTGN